MFEPSHGPALELTKGLKVKEFQIKLEGLGSVAHVGDVLEGADTQLFL